MRYNIRMKCNESTIQYEDRIPQTINKRLLSGAILTFISSIVTLLLVFAISMSGIQLVVGIFLVALFFVLSICELVMFISSTKRPYNIVVDGENLYIKHGKGYAIFNKYEFGRVVYRPSNKECNTVIGFGDELIELDNGSIRFSCNGVRVKKTTRNGKKLAYVLVNVAQNITSNKNYGQEYDTHFADKKFKIAGEEIKVEHYNDYYADSEAKHKTYDSL